MFQHRSTLAALALIVMLAAPADAQAPPSWTQAGMLRCKLNPSIGFIIAGHQSMECNFTPNGPNPPQAYLGALNTVGARHRHYGGRRAGLGRLCADDRHTCRRACRRICRCVR